MPFEPLDMSRFLAVFRLQAWLISNWNLASLAGKRSQASCRTQIRTLRKRQGLVSSSHHVCFNSIAGNRTSWWKSMDMWGWKWGIIFACRKGELQDDFELRAVSPVQHGIHLIRRSKVLYIYHHCAFLSIQNSAVLSWRCLIGWGTRAFSKRCLVMPVTRDSRGGDVISDWS